MEPGNFEWPEHSRLGRSRAGSIPCDLDDRFDTHEAPLPCPELVCQRVDETAQPMDLLGSMCMVMSDIAGRKSRGAQRSTNARSTT